METEIEEVDMVTETVAGVMGIGEVDTATEIAEADMVIAAEDSEKEIVAPMAADGVVKMYPYCLHSGQELAIFASIRCQDLPFRM